MAIRAEFVSALMFVSCYAHAAPSEASYRLEACLGMEQEVTLANGSRADCLSDTHAIEVDFTEHWAEALGQALLYAAATDLKPGIFLVCRDSQRNCLRHHLRPEEAISTWKLPVSVWPIDGKVTP
jgi:hypothetical protein